MKLDGSDSLGKLRPIKKQESEAWKKEKAEVENYASKMTQTAEMKRSVEELKLSYRKTIVECGEVLEQWDKWHFKEMEMSLKSFAPKLKDIAETLKKHTCFGDVEMLSIQKEFVRIVDVIENDVKDGITEKERAKIIEILKGAEKDCSEKISEIGKYGE